MEQVCLFVVIGMCMVVLGLIMYFMREIIAKYRAFKSPYVKYALSVISVILIILLVAVLLKSYDALILITRVGVI